MAKVDFNEKIPNNVNLADDRRLLRALESWQPAYLDWWRELGPIDSAETDSIYVTDADEIIRLFTWCDFLEQRDGVYAFYKPLVDALRSWTRGIEAFASDGRPT